MEEGMNNTNGAAGLEGTEPENPEIPEGPTPADGYEGLIDAKGLDIFAKECIAPLVGTVASLADSSLKLSERLEEMEKKVPTTVKAPVVTVGSYTYNHNEQGPEISGFDPNSITVTGATGINAGDYTLTLALKNPEKQVWDDDTTGPRTYPWSIAPKTVEVPVLADANVMYNGTAQSPTLPSVNADEIMVGGTTEATVVGTYIVTYSLANTNNYIWPDGTTASKSGEWTITPKKLAKPTLTDASKTYSGSSQSPTLSSVNADEIQIGGTMSATEAGNYTITYTLANTSNYIWSDDTTAPKSDTWAITPKKLAKPALTNASKTYNGYAQSPTLPSVNANEIQIGGTTSATNAGDYTVTYTLKNTKNYIWSDNTTAPKSDAWKINRAAGSLSLNKTSMGLNVSTLTGTIVVTRAGNGAITASSSNTGVATVSVSGTTVTVTAKANGSATITINVAAGTNHTAPASKTCAVTVTMPTATLNNNSPATIQAAARAGTAANYWKVGDRIGVAINGTVGSLALNGTYYAFIIGFNHNSGIEGGKSIHFQFGKTANGTDIAFCDAGYGSHYSENANSRFVMHYDGYGTANWKDSYMRNTICPAFLAALPTEWKNVIVECTKYSDNTGGASNSDNALASWVTATKDKIWPLAEFEAFGRRQSANNAEQNYQKQYDYYKNGNSRIKYMHNNTSIAVKWWLRSPMSFNYFNTVTPAGDEEIYFRECTVDYSYGFAPGCMVA